MPRTSLATARQFLSGNHIYSQTQFRMYLREMTAICFQPRYSLRVTRQRLRTRPNQGCIWCYSLAWTIFRKRTLVQKKRSFDFHLHTKSRRSDILPIVAPFTERCKHCFDPVQDIVLFRQDGFVSALNFTEMRARNQMRQRAIRAQQRRARAARRTP